MWEERLPAERCRHLPSWQGQGENLAALSPPHIVQKISIKKLCKKSPVSNTNIVLDQLIREGWPPSFTASFHCFNCCNVIIKIFPANEDISVWDLVFYTAALSAATLIAGPGLLRTERSRGLSGAQGDVCVSDLCNSRPFCSVFFFAFVTLAAFHAAFPAAAGQFSPYYQGKSLYTYIQTLWAVITIHIICFE